MYHIDFPTKEALAAIMKRCDNDAAKVHAELDKYKSIRRRMRGIDEKSRQLEEVHADKLKRMAMDRRAIVDECDHIDVEYHPDASGNNSRYECKICGKDLGRRPSRSEIANHHESAAYDG